jgi:hypothetical protein
VEPQAAGSGGAIPTVAGAVEPHLRVGSLGELVMHLDLDRPR